MYAQINADGSIKSICTQRQGAGDIEIILPDGFEWENLDFYECEGGAISLNEQKYAQHLGDLDRARRQAHMEARAEELLAGRVLAKAAAELASGGTNDEIITVAAYLPEWTLTNYTADMVGQVFVYDGAPYRLGQAHNAANYPNDTPRTLGALWWAYHGTTVETALPWQAPGGAHDLYMAGEMMVWTDGLVYRCTADTAYSPDQYAPAWERVF